MKKSIKLVIVLLTILIVSGCGSKINKAEMYTIYRGEELRIGNNMDTLTISYYPNKLIDTNDKTITHYRNNSIGFAVDKDNIIIRIYFLDDIVKTPEGIKLGSTFESVREAYGVKTHELGEVEIRKDGVKLYMQIDNDEKVKYIAYLKES